jgi:class 3 adenylate cyclase
LTTNPASPPPADELEKENRRLTRRLQRLEDNVRRLEEFQDSNSTLQSRLLTELEEERARSERLLLNVLPQRIVDRLAAGETLIADRHEAVSVLFCDVVGFTEISARLAPATPILCSAV